MNIGGADTQNVIGNPKILLGADEGLSERRLQLFHIFGLAQASSPDVPRVSFGVNLGGIDAED